MTAPEAARILEWWEPSELRRQRDRLPWRDGCFSFEAWPVLVSEVMLAQTQTGRAEGRFRSFIEQFPSPSSMAAVPLGDVLRAWSGLGYPRRAANLHRAARDIVGLHRGRVPDQLPALLGLPGVGRYTARAVMAFAYDRCVMPVDTNVGRVLARAVSGQRLTIREAQACGDELSVSSGRGGRLIAQAFMDFGAGVCQQAVPHCDDCVLGGAAMEAPVCPWFRARSAAVAAGAPPPDPAISSAAVSGRQARFEGSDRQGRGRLLRAATVVSIDRREAAEIAGWPADPERASRALASLVADGLLVASGPGRYVLP